jgi:hypothetical protein
VLERALAALDRGRSAPDIFQELQRVGGDRGSGGAGVTGPGRRRRDTDQIDATD